MDITREYNINNNTYNVSFKGSVEEPLVKAADIGKILGLTNINKNLKDFDNNEKVILNEMTIKGIQDINYLTINGVKNILNKSRKPNADNLLKWYENEIENFKNNTQNIIKNNQKYHNELVFYVIQKNNQINNNEYIINFDKNYNNYINNLKLNNEIFDIIYEKLIDENNKYIGDFIIKLLEKYNISSNIYLNNNNNLMYIINYVFNILNIINNTNQDTDNYINNINNINDIDNINNISYIKENKNNLNIIDKLNDNLLIEDNEINRSFNKFISECCIIGLNNEESTDNLIGQYRIWSKKASDEIFHSLGNYLKIKFKHTRLKIQNKSNVIYGYQGIKLKEINYQKKYENNNIENFIFDVCNFSPSGKVIFKNLLDKFNEWKINNNLDINNSEKDDLKDFLKKCNYVLPSNVYVNKQNGLGYYGIFIKSEEKIIEKKPQNGKIIEKRNATTNEIIDIYDTIAKAADSEKIPPSTMSRYIKNKQILNNYYFSIKN